MHFSAAVLAVLISSLALTGASRAPIDTVAVEARAKTDNAAKVLSDITAVTADLTTLNKTLNTFKPDAVLGIETAQKIQTQTAAISSKLNATIAAVKASKPFNSGESFNLAEATVGLIAPTNSTIINLVKHKPAFASVEVVADLSKTVEAALKQQKQLSQELGNALGPKLASPYGQFAPEVTAEIVGIFTKAIKKYSSCSGGSVGGL